MVLDRARQQVVARMGSCGVTPFGEATRADVEQALLHDRQDEGPGAEGVVGGVRR